MFSGVWGFPSGLDDLVVCWLVTDCVGFMPWVFGFSVDWGVPLCVLVALMPVCSGQLILVMLLCGLAVLGFAARGLAARFAFLWGWYNISLVGSVG